MERLNLSSNLSNELAVFVRRLPVQDYATCWQSMQDFTNQRDSHTQDEIWVLQHKPVFTQGQAGKAEHLLNQGDIPLVQSDRGGQVTYHGPGQLMVYLMLDLKRLKLGVRDLVTHMEKALITCLARFDINAYAKADAPGVYVDSKKIASLGLRVRKGCSFHGMALNVDMDLSPFERINPCGYPGLEMVQAADLAPLSKPITIELMADDLCHQLITQLQYQKVSDSKDPWALHLKTEYTSDN